MPTFKTAIDTLTVLVTDAADGGRKAISAKQKHREVVMKMYKTVAALYERRRSIMVTSPAVTDRRYSF